MGLSVAISGGIILTVFVLLLLSLPGLADKMFSIGDITTQVTQHEQKISNTEISLETLFATSGSPYVNFTLNNDNQEKLWNFEKFNIIIEYESASGDELEELSFSGNCLGDRPAIGNWCIEGISGDFIDENILNEGESAEIWTRVSQNLVSGNSRVTVSTDNGEVAMLPAPKRSWSDTVPIPPATCEFATYGRTFVDTDTGISYICDPTRDKWLSIETITLFGEETVASCAAGADPGSSANCNVDWGDALGPDAATDLGLYLPYNATVIAYGFSEDNDACTSGSMDVEMWSSPSNTDDNTFVLEQTIAAALTNEAHTANNLDIDIVGDEFKLWGIDNNCGQAIDDFNIILYLKWKHD
jgi:hypothetical protein